ncbi:hypothetical protein EC960932_2540, partial [Escherichia coli 96.0932]
LKFCDERNQLFQFLCGDAM